MDRRGQSALTIPPDHGGVYAATGNQTIPPGPPARVSVLIIRATIRNLFRAIARRQADRGRRIQLTRDWAISAVVLGLGLWIGASCLPTRPTRAPDAVTLIDPQAAFPAVAQGVFALRPDGGVVRFANAEMVGRGTIRVGFYDPVDPLLTHAVEPVLLPADARLLWLLAAPAERQAIRDRAAALVFALSSDAREILASDVFAAHYRDRFTAVFRHAAYAAWDATQDGGAWWALWRDLDPALRRMVQRDLRPVIQRHFRGVPGRMLRANAWAMLDPFTDRPWNMAPVEEALHAALVELRDRGIAERAITQLIDSPQAATFLRTYQDELVRGLAHDPALSGLLAEMLYDERLRPHVGNVLARANELARYAPRLLVSLRGGQELNLVAATVIRATITGRGDRVVVFMSAAQRAEIAALDPAVVAVLERRGRS